MADVRDVAEERAEGEPECIEPEGHDFRYLDSWDEPHLKLRVTEYECRLCGARRQKQEFPRPKWARHL